MTNFESQSPTEPPDVSSITMLIERAKEGCDTSRARVIERLKPFMLSMAARYNDQQLQRKQGVSDIVQQSLVRVIENFDSFHGSSAAEFRAWLKSLVINEIRQIHRAWHRDRRDVKRERSLDAKKLKRGGGVSATDPTPLTSAILKEQIAALKDKIARLSPLQQSVIQMRVREGLTFAEIGEKLDRNSGTVSKIWYRLLIQLEQMMAEK